MSLLSPATRLGRAASAVLAWAADYTWAFVLIMTVTVVSCAFSIHYLSSLEANLKDVYENDIRGGDAVQTASTALASVGSSVRDLLLFPDRKARTRAVIQERVKVLNASMASAAPRFYTPRAQRALSAAKDDLAAYLDALDGLFLNPAPGKAPDLRALAALESRAAELQKDFDLLILNRYANSTKGISDLVFQLRVSLVVTIAILLITVVVRVILYFAGHPRRKREG